MFIRNLSQGGYKGDVNTAFRFGRRQAFDDYIDAYSKGLKADVDTYNFNQANVRDTASNYQLGVGMDKVAQQQAIDFVNNNNKLNNDVQKAEIDFHRRDTVAPHVSYMGEQLGQAEVMKSSTGNFNAQRDNVLAEGNANRANQDVTNADLGAKLKFNQLGNNLTKEQLTDNLYKVQEQLAHFDTEDGRKEVEKNYLAERLFALQNEDKANGVSRTDDDRLNAIMANQDEYRSGLEKFSNIKRQQLINQANYYKGTLSSTATPDGSKIQDIKTTKSEKQQKPIEWKTTNDVGEIATATEKIGTNMYRVPNTNKVYIVSSNGKQKVAQVATVSDDWIIQKKAEYEEKKKVKVDANGNKTLGGITAPANER